MIEGTENDIVVPCVAIDRFFEERALIFFFDLSVMGPAGVGKSTVHTFIRFCSPCLMLIEMIYSTCTSSSTTLWAKTPSLSVMTSSQRLRT